MSSDNARIFDDLTRVAGGAASLLSALGRQLQSGIKDQMGSDIGAHMFGGHASHAANDDVERLQGTITKLRIEQDALKARVAALESLLGTTKAKAKPAPKKAAAPKAPVKKAPVKKAAAKSPARKKTK